MDSRRPAVRRIAIYAAVVGVAFGVLLLTGSIPSSEEARDFGDDLGPLAPVLFVPLFVAVNFLITWPILAGEQKGRLLPQRTKPVEDFLTRHGAAAVMQSRIVPLLPWGAVNYSAGVTHLAYRAMAIGTAIGAAPKVFAYTALGGSLGDLTSPEALVAIGLLVVLALAGALVVRRQIRATPSPREAAGTPRPASGRHPG